MGYQAITDDDYVKLAKRIVRRYRKFSGDWCPEAAKDCVQHIMTAWLEKIDRGGEIKQTLDHAVIDFLRNNGSGRKGTSSYEGRRALSFALKNAEFIDESQKPAKGMPQKLPYVNRVLNPEYVEKCFPADVTDPIMMKQIVKVLSQKHRVICFLYVRWGLTLKEIAECFGVTESRVAQQLDEVERFLRGEIKTADAALLRAKNEWEKRTKGG